MVSLPMSGPAAPDAEIDDPPAYEDLALIEAFKRGDTSAFARLCTKYDRYFLMLATSAMRGNAEDGLDLLQDCYLHAIQCVSKHDVQHFCAWMRQVIFTKGMNKMQRTRHATSLDDTHDVSLLDTVRNPNAPTPVQILARREIHALRRDVVHRALATIKDPTRQTAELFYLQDMRIKDIALLLSAPEGTIKRRLFVARQRMEQVIDGMKIDRDPAIRQEVISPTLNGY